MPARADVRRVTVTLLGGAGARGRRPDGLSESALVSIAGALGCDVADRLPGPEEPAAPEVTAAARLLSEIEPEPRDGMITMLRRPRRSSTRRG